MRFVPDWNQLKSFFRAAQFVLSPQATQRAKRRHWKLSAAIIRTYDINFQSELSKARLSDGFIFDENVVRLEDRVYLLNTFKNCPTVQGRLVNYYVPLIDKPMAVIMRALIDSYLPDMKVYLGPSLRLDNYYFHATTTVSLRSRSSSWHTDNVGHRIKMFITLQSDGKTPTAYMPGSNRKLYRAPLVEQFRIFGIMDRRKKRGETLIRHEVGSVALLDTNGLHRGVYEASQVQRLCFVVEFIGREKADALVGRSLPVGPQIVPGRDPTRFTQEAATILSDLLDKKLLHNVDDGIQVYGLKRPSQDELVLL